jgi:phosphoserine phosphatase RsbU/P
LRNGDVLVAYSDGISEALNPEDQEFGEDRLEKTIASAACLPPADVIAKILDRVCEWCRDAPQHDDMTLVVLKVK